MISNEILLKVNNLKLSFSSRKAPDQQILKGISFELKKGEVLGIIGNSGSGKTITAMTIAGLLPSNASVTSGSIEFEGRELLKLSKQDRRKLLGNDIGVIFQEPTKALDPLMSVEKNLAEVLIAHGQKDKLSIRKQIVSMLDLVGFTNSSEILLRYPHQLSGGQRQRILIAGAALLKPSLLICDEPTSALDTITTVSTLELLRSLADKLDITMLFISHDLCAVGSFCDRVCVVNDGCIIETDITKKILRSPSTDFARELLSKSRLDPSVFEHKLQPVDYSAKPVYEAKMISAGYNDSMFSSAKVKNYIEDISFNIYPSEILGLIGSSGSGKTTLAKIVCGLMKPSCGYSTPIKSGLGVVFQDPVTCLNPSHKILWHLLEPLKASKARLSSKDMREKAIKAITEVGMDESYFDRFPNELSGGQRQRVAIAMCLILRPTLIIVDEPFSSLDSSSAESILKLLLHINRKYNASILLISHNLHIVRSIASRVIVLEGGKLVEDGKTSEVFNNPASSTTKKLLDAEHILFNII